jgi:Fe2+ or Zn2+ uptake regulation protein
MEQESERYQVDRLANEILRYLREHPQASDNAEGIAKWWIKRQRLEEALHQVQEALDRLVAHSLVDALPSGGGGTRYALRSGPDGTHGVDEGGD